MAIAFPTEYPTDIETVISLLRQRDYSIVDTIQFLKQNRDLSLAEAKKCVHLSETWADMRADNDALHDEVMAALSDATSDSRQTDTPKV